MINEIFYSECISCSKIISLQDLLCENCIKKLTYVKSKCSTCGSPLKVNNVFCKNCLENNNYEYLYVLFWYKGIIREIIKRIKFRYTIKDIQFIKQLILNTNINLKTDYDIIISCPSHFFRKPKRFIHPADIVCKELSKKHNITMEKTLKRIKHTDFQWKMNKKKRKINIKGAFTNIKNVSGLKILLVDDILTTGATLNECASVLKRAGAVKVDCFVLARGFYK